VHTGRTLQLTDNPRMIGRFPHWSPSGEWVAYHRQDIDEPEIPLLIFHGAWDTVATTEEMQAIHDSVVAAGSNCGTGQAAHCNIAHSGKWSDGYRPPRR
jgi:hypothetical protein